MSTTGRIDGWRVVRDRSGNVVAGVLAVLYEQLWEQAEQRLGRTYDDLVADGYYSQDIEMWTK